LSATDVKGPEGRTRIRFFEVNDTGIGIAEHARERIFQPFTGTAEPRERGTGLGLPISKKLVD
jgi:signal transduction histidine kinase